VHVADDGLGAGDALAVERHAQAQDTVRGRVLRPDVQHHVGGVDAGGQPAGADPDGSRRTLGPGHA
jgi:hypothetical protein